jgi:hypothetical protein
MSEVVSLKIILGAGFRLKQIGQNLLYKLRSNKKSGR